MTSWLRATRNVVLPPEVERGEGAVLAHVAGHCFSAAPALPQYAALWLRATRLGDEREPDRCSCPAQVRLWLRATRLHDVEDGEGRSGGVPAWDERSWLAGAVLGGGRT